MVENLEQEKAIIERLPEGSELTEYLTERFGWEFREVLNPDLPIPSRACAVTLAKESEAKWMNALIIQYTKRNRIIIDGFGIQHDSRRSFFTTVLGSKSAWLGDQSKLRFNPMSACLEKIDFLLIRLRRDGVLVNFDRERIVQALAKHGPRYSEMDIEHKIAYAKTFDEQIYAFFLALSEATSQVTDSE